MDKQRMNCLLSNIFWNDHDQCRKQHFVHKVQKIHRCGFSIVINFMAFIVVLVTFLSPQLLKRENTLVLHTNYDVKDKKDPG